MAKTTLIIGRKPLLEALRAGQAIDKILFQRNVSGESIGEIRKLAKENQVPILQVPGEKLRSLSRANHQGVIAFSALIPYLQLQDVIDQVNGNGQSPLFIMLDGITDVRNIGAIARSAVCCGAQALIIPSKGMGALNEEAMKSSAGALQSIQVCRENSLLKAIDQLHLNGIKVYTTEIHAEKKLFQLDLKVPCCLILGSEDKGVQPHLSKAADERAAIPMAGHFNSFNVSVAAGIMLYEALKQRG
jgi:23S rRNA (guanosine2251-2'-O)-methyltransferase